MYVLYLSRATAIVVVDWCQFGPSWIFWAENGSYYLCRLGWRYNGAKLSFSWPYMIVSMIWNTSKLSPSQLSRATAILLLIGANLALTGYLGRKLSLWPISAWLEVQQSKAVFFLTLYVRINDMKYFLNVCIISQPCHSHFCCWLLPIWP